MHCQVEDNQQDYWKEHPSRPYLLATGHPCYHCQGGWATVNKGREWEQEKETNQAVMNGDGQVFSEHPQKRISRERTWSAGKNLLRKKTIFLSFPDICYFSTEN